MFKRLLGLAPQLEPDGSYRPSKFALKVATSATTDYDSTTYQNKYSGNKKVLMICTEEKNMTMANGKMFSTGNHPVEMIVPMLHLRSAGFDIDVFTPTGKPVQIEMWAMPQDDKKVKSIYSEYKTQFENPRSLSDFVGKSMKDNTDYIAVYIPGGHGAMLGLPDNPEFGKLLRWTHERDLFLLAICHGAAALLAADLDNKNAFIFDGYKIAAFPDSVDKQTPMIGYMPGHMPWIFGEKLEKLGVTIINKKADDTCHVDRKLISGASPKAANGFGRLAAITLLKELG